MSVPVEEYPSVLSGECDGQVEEVDGAEGARIDSIDCLVEDVRVEGEWGVEEEVSRGQVPSD